MQKPTNIAYISFIFKKIYVPKEINTCNEIL